jgi:hypothetical protein
MKTDFRGPLIAIAAVLVLSFGIYWGVAVSPKRDQFWAKVSAVTDVSDARIEIDGKLVALKKSDAERVFNLMRSSPDYSPNHPASRRRGWITFGTNQGDIRFSLLDTSNQGVLLWAFSSGDTGWNYGTKRCDDVGAYLPIAEDKKAQE